MEEVKKHCSIVILLFVTTYLYAVESNLTVEQYSKDCHITDKISWTK